MPEILDQITFLHPVKLPMTEKELLACGDETRRCDTGEVVLTRKMSDAEYRRPLPFKDGPEKKDKPEDSDE